MEDLVSRYLDIAKGMRMNGSEIAQVAPPYNDPASNVIYGAAYGQAGGRGLPRIRSAEETENALRIFKNTTTLPTGVLKMGWPGV